MSWAGKIIGGLLGLVVFGPLGMILGVLIGHQFDVGLSRSSQGWDLRTGFADPRRIRESFFRTTFLVMGHIAKADGRVSEGEIRAARSVMHQMRLPPEHVREAINLFTHGKQRNFPLDQALQDFRRTCHHRDDLCRAFVEIQVQAALAADSLNAAERDVLWRVCQALGITRVQLAQIEALVRLQQGLHRGARARSGSLTPLVDSYKVLGVEAQASDAEIKKAYRRLINQHHPDKLVARGLPESMMEVAEEKTRQIRGAYERIKEARGMR